MYVVRYLVYWYSVPVLGVNWRGFPCYLPSMAHGFNVDPVAFGRAEKEGIGGRRDDQYRNKVIINSVVLVVYQQTRLPEFQTARYGR